MTNLPIVYIAGPYRSTTEHGVFGNIVKAREAACQVFRLGGFALCPHLNSAFMGGVVPDEAFLAGDLRLIQLAADALWMVDGWEQSTGATAERDHAKKEGIPVFGPDDIDHLAEWIREWKAT